MSGYPTSCVDDLQPFLFPPKASLISPALRPAQLYYNARSTKQPDNSGSLSRSLRSFLVSAPTRVHHLDPFLTKEGQLLAQVIIVVGHVLLL